jgi:hypothetical protein
MNDCSKHKKDVAGISDMKLLAEMIGDLHYESLAELFHYLEGKIGVDAFYDYVGDRPKLSFALGEASEHIARVAKCLDHAYQISKPFMNNKDNNL